VAESWQYYAKLKTPDANDHILHYFVYMKCLG
jgi:hypothetical protein